MNFSFRRADPVGPNQNIVPNQAPEKKVNVLKKVNDAMTAKVNDAMTSVKASIAQVQVSSKATQAWNWTKEQLPRIAYTTAILSAAVLIGVGLYLGASLPLMISAYAIGGSALLGAGIYEYKKAKNIDNHAKELYKAVKEFDDLNPSSNRYVTALERYIKAKQTIQNDLIRLNPADRKAFIRRIASAAKDDPNFRINTNDGRYGVVLEKLKKGASPKGATFEQFVKSIVDIQADQVQVAYDKELKSYAETFADTLKNDVMMSRKIRHHVNEAAYKMASKKEYRMLGKGLSDIANDLLGKIKDQLGERYVKREMNKLEGLMVDRYGFWSAVEGFRKTVRKDFDKKFEAKNKLIKDLENQLKNLDDVEAGLAKEKVSLLAIARKTDNTPERIQTAEARIAELDAKREEIKAQRDAIGQEIEQLKLEQAQIEGKLGYEYLIDLNARRRELARLLGKEDVKDFELPGHPTFGDKLKYWTPRAAVGAAVVAGAYYGLPYAKPYVGPYADKVGVAVTGAYASGLPYAKSYVGPYVDKVGGAVTGAYSWTKGLFGSKVEVSVNN